MLYVEIPDSIGGRGDRYAIFGFFGSIWRLCFAFFSKYAEFSKNSIAFFADASHVNFDDCFIE